MRQPAAIWAAAGLAAALLASTALAQTNPQPTPAQYLIYSSDGALIGVQTARAGGHGGTLIARELAYTVDGHDQTRSRSSMEIAHTQDGLSLHFAFSASSAPDTSHTIVIRGATAAISSQRRGAEARTVEQVIDPALPFAQPEFLGQLPSGPFLTFNPASGRLARREGRFVPFPSTDEPGREAYLVLEAGELVDALVVVRTAGGELLSARRPQFGTYQEFRPQDASDPPNPLFGTATIDHPLIPSPYDVTREARRGHLRFRFGLPGDLAAALPQTGQQRVTVEGAALRLDICDACGPALPSDEASLARWRAGSGWMQTDYAPIRRAAARIARSNESDSAKMDALSRIARARLRDVDFSGHYTARDAWNRRAGDCTEDALLLATLARAAGIPALVASGMVYTRERYHGARDAFMPHSWVVAYLDGQWRSYDMTLGEFDASHIALTLGDGSARQVANSYLLAGLLDWQGMSEVRPRPAQ